MKKLLLLAATAIAAITFGTAHADDVSYQVRGSSGVDYLASEPSFVEAGWHIINHCSETAAPGYVEVCRSGFSIHKGSKPHELRNVFIMAGADFDFCAIGSDRYQIGFTGPGEMVYADCSPRIRTLIDDDIANKRGMYANRP